MTIPHFHVCFPCEELVDAPANSLCYYIDGVSAIHSPLLQEAQARAMLNSLFALRPDSYHGISTSGHISHQEFHWNRKTILRRDIISDKGYNYIGVMVGQVPSIVGCSLSNRIPLPDLRSLALMLDGLGMAAVLAGKTIVCAPTDHARYIVRDHWEARLRDVTQRHFDSPAILALRDKPQTVENNGRSFEVLFQPKFSLTTYSIDVDFYGDASKCEVRVIATREIAESLYNVYRMRVEIADETF